MNWNEQQMVAFIEMYRDRSVLWNSSYKQYKNKNKRLMDFEIAVSFGINEV